MYYVLFVFPTKEHLRLSMILTALNVPINIFVYMYLPQINSPIAIIWYFTFIYLFLSGHFSPERLPVNSNAELVNGDFKTFRIDSSELIYK